MSDQAAQGIAFAAIVFLGGLFYSFISSKIELTWSKIIPVYLVSASILMLGIAAESEILTIVGFVPMVAFGILAYGKMFSK